MKTQSTNILLTMLASLCSVIAFAQTNKPVAPLKTPFVDFDAYEKLVAEVKQHRQSRLLSAWDFRRLSETGKDRVIILDTRSDSAFAAVHIKGAVHLNFSDFTQENLAKIIPSRDHIILIYCNNNFDISDIDNTLVDEQRFAQVMATKSVQNPTYNSDAILKMITSKSAKGTSVAKPVPTAKSLTLALNIPTYINLYGYGYKNVYELGELVNTHDGIIMFEGTAVK